MVTAFAQLVGYLVATAGVFLLVGSPWILVGAGAVLLIVPEIVQEVRRRDPAPSAVRARVTHER